MEVENNRIKSEIPRLNVSFIWMKPSVGRPALNPDWHRFPVSFQNEAPGKDVLAPNGKAAKWRLIVSVYQWRGGTPLLQVRITEANATKPYARATNPWEHFDKNK